MAVKEGMKVGPDKVTIPLQGNNWNLFLFQRSSLSALLLSSWTPPTWWGLTWMGQTFLLLRLSPPLKLVLAWSIVFLTSWSRTDVDPSCFQSCQRGRWSWASLTSAQLTSGGKETKPMCLIMIKVTNWQSQNYDQGETISATLSHTMIKVCNPPAGVHPCTASSFRQHAHPRSGTRRGWRVSIISEEYQQS